MAQIKFNAQNYTIQDIPSNIVFAISTLNKSSKVYELNIVQDLASLLIRGYSFANKKPFKEVNTNLIKDNIFNLYKTSSNAVQKSYLRRTRKFWEDKFSFEEMLWMVDYRYCLSELEGTFSDNWYMLYGLIIGDLPKDFPKEVSFACLIENVLYNKINKYIHQTIKKYLEDNPTAILAIKNGKVPKDISTYPIIGLDEKAYVKYVG